MGARVYVLAVLLVTLGLSATAIQAAEFIPLGDFAGGSTVSVAIDLTPDGSTVVGYGTTSAGQEAFRWTRQGGLQPLGYLPGGSTNSRAYAISDDGSVITGYSNSSIANTEPFRWTSATGMVGLGQFGQPMAASGDGGVVVGLGSGSQAFRWTQSTGVVLLGTPTSIAYDVSSDGSVLVGIAGGLGPVRWTQSTGWQLIPLSYPTSPALKGGSAYGISPDGSAVVGYALHDNGGNEEAFRYTDADGLELLGDLPGGIHSASAFAASLNGSIIVGQSVTSGTAQAHFGLGIEAFVWDEQSGMRKLSDVLSSHGIDMTGWTLRQASAISDDGLTIVGNGFNPAGEFEAFVAVIPEPTGLMLASLLLIPLRRRRR